MTGKGTSKDCGTKKGSFQKKKGQREPGERNTPRFKGNVQGWWERGGEKVTKGKKRPMWTGTQAQGPKGGHRGLRTGAGRKDFLGRTNGGECQGQKTDSGWFGGGDWEGRSERHAGSREGDGAIKGCELTGLFRSQRRQEG